MLKSVLFAGLFLTINAQYRINTIKEDVDDYVTFDNFSRIHLPVDFANDILAYLDKSPSELSPTCLAQVKVYCGDLKNKLHWALKMFDASSRLPAGLISGNIGSFGQYDQCLEIDEETSVGNIIGNHCVGMFSKNVYKNLWKMHFEDSLELTMHGISSAYWSVCLPNVCTVQDVKNIMGAIGFRAFFKENTFCRSRTTGHPIDLGDKICIGLILLLMILAIASTAYDSTMEVMHKDHLNLVLTSFSLLTNGRKLMAVNFDNPTHIYTLDGLRIFSLFCITLCNRYMNVFLLPASNYSKLIEIAHSRFSMVIFSGLIAIDTMYMSGGMIVSYNYLSRGMKINLWKYYLLRYIRLGPPLGMVVLIYLTVAKHLGDGPLWDILVENIMMEDCRTHWWATILLFENWILSSCVIQGYYIGIDFQMWLLSPIFLHFIPSRPQFILKVAACLALLSAAVGFFVGYYFSLRAFLLTNKLGVQRRMFLQLYFVATYMRACPWFCGFIIGYVVYTLQNDPPRFQLTDGELRIILSVIWFCAFGLIFAAFLSGYRLVIHPTYHVAGNVLYIGLVLPAWAIGVGWVILACNLGYGGFLQWFLSLGIFQVTSKLTYTMYVTHILTTTVILARTRQALELSHLKLIHDALGDALITFFLAVWLTLFVEYPLVRLTKVLLGNQRYPAYPKSAATLPKVYVTTRRQTMDDIREAIITRKAQ